MKKKKIIRIKKIVKKKRVDDFIIKWGKNVNTLK